MLTIHCLAPTHIEPVLTSCKINQTCSYFRTISKNGGSPPLTYQRLQTVLSQLGPPPKPVQLGDTFKSKLC